MKVFIFMAQFFCICIEAVFIHLTLIMAKSKETFNKREKEKQRQQQKRQKREKMEERKANGSKSKSLDDMMAYIDENGNITSTPPDPSRKKTFKAEEIEIGVPKQSAEAEDEANSGIVDYFNTSKGFGFIKDNQTGERLFFHVNQLQESIDERDKVTYDIEKGPKGFNAVNIKKL
jgi:cold shock CspA family protein